MNINNLEFIRMVNCELTVLGLWAMLSMATHCGARSQTYFPNYSVCTMEHAYTIIQPITVHQCGKECVRRRHCEGISYHRGTLTCGLRDTPVDQTKAAVVPGCYSADRANMTEYYTRNRPCYDNSMPCSLTEQCSNSDISEGYKCKVAECMTPALITNAALKSSLRGVGIKNKYHCNDGYLASGEDQIICQTNGTWSITDFTCLAKCGIPSINFTWFQNISNTYTVNDTVTFTCIRGYYSSEPIVLKCNNNGKWQSTSVATECTQDCGRPYLGHAIPGIDELYPHFGSNVTFTCDDGYYSPEPIIHQCVEGGQWMNISNVTECTQDCGLSELDNAIAAIDDMYPHFRSNVTFNCYAGYFSHDSIVQQCVENGQWLTTSSETACIRICSAPNVLNAIQMIAEVGNNLPDIYPVGTIIQFICIEGYNSVLPIEQECMDSGLWETTSLYKSCVQVCTTLVLDNAEPSSGDYFFIGTRVYVTCIDGYYSSEDPASNRIYRTCDATATWIGITECRGTCTAPVFSGLSLNQPTKEIYADGEITNWTCDCSCAGNVKKICNSGTWEHHDGQCIAYG